MSHFADEHQYSGQMTLLQRARDLLVAEIDAAHVVPLVRKYRLLTPEEERTILDDPDTAHRTEIFLDLLEMKSPDAFEKVCDCLADTYPHVYLAIQGEGPEGSDDGKGEM